MGNKCEQGQSSGREAEATSRSATTAAPLPPQVIEQIAQIVKEWNLAEIASPATPLPRLYVRPDEAAQIIGVSKRTLSAWQSARVIPFRRVGRTVLFSVPDIQAAIDRYRVAPIGEPKPHNITTPRATNAAVGEPRPKGRRQMQRIKPV